MLISNKPFLVFKNLCSEKIPYKMSKNKTFNTHFRLKYAQSETTFF